MTNATLITGNTFPVKDAIKALGGRWDADAKGWRVPAARAAEAQKLVAGAPRNAGGWAARATHRTGGKWTGCSCGSRDGVSRPSDCFTCRHDAD